MSEELSRADLWRNAVAEAFATDTAIKYLEGEITNLCNTLQGEKDRAESLEAHNKDLKTALKIANQHLNHLRGNQAPPETAVEPAEPIPVLPLADLVPVLQSEVSVLRSALTDEQIHTERLEKDLQAVKERAQRSEQGRSTVAAKYDVLLADCQRMRQTASAANAEADNWKERAANAVTQEAIWKERALKAEAMLGGCSTPGPVKALWEPRPGAWAVNTYGIATQVAVPKTNDSPVLFGLYRDTAEQARGAAAAMRAFNRMLAYRDEVEPDFYSHNEAYLYHAYMRNPNRWCVRKAWSDVAIPLRVAFVSRENCEVLCEKLNSGEVVL